ncbi:hypothetical protein F66182_9716 [Fusarium sp. NRRL 66182]|nr:hypothetical protein F66182_9716 [Fusarium sp. NRRL 66182]
MEKLEKQLRHLQSQKENLVKSKLSQKPKKNKKSTSEDAHNSTAAETSPADDNFDEALDVVRRVYGVEKPQKTKKGKKKGKRPDDDGGETTVQDPATTTETAKESNTGVNSPWSIAQQAGMWTSLREKLQQQHAVEPSDDEHAMASSILDQDQQSVPSNQEGEFFEDTSILTSDALQLAEETEVSSATPAEDVTPAEDATQPSAKGKKSRKKSSKAVVQTIVPSKLQLEPVEQDSTKEVPNLAYNLDKILFNPGVYQLQDRRSLVYNFDPYLGSIMPVKEFDFNALKEYITSSKDTRLRDLSAKHGKKFCGSTSSMTAMLSHFHFLLSAWRKPNFDHLSRSFPVEFESFTVLTRGPAAAFARYQDGVYAIDADKEYDSANILSMLGKSMEKLLTLPKESFEKYRKTKSHELSEEEKNADEAFHYTTFGDFMMRSQLDAFDKRLPGTGMFDLKTRAVVSIRMDVGDYEKGTGYEIRNRFGNWESFEREYYDMIRAAFLKYSLQVRMGRMDGIFVAFHNTQRIFGFQYISLEEMDMALHGTMDRSVGDEEFKASLGLLNEVLDRASKQFPERSLRLHIETRPTNPPLTYFFAEPVDEETIQRTQETGRASVEKFEQEILGLSKKEIQAEQMTLKDELAAQAEEENQELEDSQEPELVEDPQRQRVWDEMMARVDHTVENDASGLQSVREAIEQALEQSGLLAGKSETERNAYLNELVEALTEELEDGKEGVKESENVSEKDSAVEDSPEVDEASQSSLGDKPSPEAQEALTQSYPVPEGDGSGLGSDLEHVTSSEETVLTLTEASETVIEDGTKEDNASAEVVDDSALSEEIVQSLANTGEIAAENTVEEEDTSADVAGEGVVTTASSFADSSLKDLIIKVAQGVDNKASNLGTFERVLSELVRDQKQLNDEAIAIPTGDIETTEAEEPEATSTTKDDKPKREILGMYITVRNKIGNETVERIEGPTNKKSQWVVEYTVTELPTQRARTILQQLKTRRKKALTTDPELRTMLWHKLWGGKLAKSTAAGERYRQQVTREEKRRKGVKVAWKQHTLPHNILPKQESDKTKDE